MDSNDTSGNLSLVGTLTVTGNISITSGSTTTTSGTKTTTVSAGGVTSTDTGLGITGLQGGLVSGAVFAQGTFGGVNYTMAANLWSIQFGAAGSPVAEIGSGATSSGFVKINGTQVLSTRVGTTPVTLADVIAVLQHHGLSS
jgi:hypothetical protein